MLGRKRRNLRVIFYLRSNFISHIINGEFGSFQRIRCNFILRALRYEE